MTFVVVLIIVAALVFMIVAGYRDGTFFTVYMVMRNLIGFLCAMTFCRPAAHFLAALAETGPIGYDYLVAISFGIIAGAVCMLGRWLKMTYTIAHVPCIALVDKFAGPIAGLLNGIVLTGTLLIFWSLLPFAKYIPANFGHINIAKVPLLDTGAAMLRFYSHVETRMGGTKFLLSDEIVKDTNANGRCDPGEDFYDLNDNGKWDRGALWQYRNHGMITTKDFEPLHLTEPTSPEDD